MSKVNKDTVHVMVPLEIREELKDEPKALLLLETLLQAYEDYGCKQYFNIGDKEIISKTKLSTKTVVSKRQLLVDKGYIIYDKGKWGGKNSIGRNSTYQLTFLGDFISTTLEENNGITNGITKESTKGITKESTKGITKESTNNGSVLSNNSLIDTQTMNTEDSFSKGSIKEPYENVQNTRTINPSGVIEQLNVKDRLKSMSNWNECLELADKVKNEVTSLKLETPIEVEVFNCLKNLFAARYDEIKTAYSEDESIEKVIKDIRFNERINYDKTWFSTLQLTYQLREEVKGLGLEEKKASAVLSLLEEAIDAEAYERTKRFNNEELWHATEIYFTCIPTKDGKPRGLLHETMLERELFNSEGLAMVEAIDKMVKYAEKSGYVTTGVEKDCLAKCCFCVWLKHRNA